MEKRSWNRLLHFGWLNPQYQLIRRVYVCDYRMWQRTREMESIRFRCGCRDWRQRKNPKMWARNFIVCERPNKMTREQRGWKQNWKIRRFVFLMENFLMWLIWCNGLLCIRLICNVRVHVTTNSPLFVSLSCFTALQRKCIFGFFRTGRIWKYGMEHTERLVNAHKQITKILKTSRSFSF